MFELLTEADLFDAGAQWTIKPLLDGETIIKDADTLLRNRFGGTLVASTDTIRSFVRLTGQAMQAAKGLESGVIPDLETVPVLPSPMVPTRFTTQGIVTVTATDLGDAEEPFEATVPFQTQTQEQQSLEEIAAGIATAIRDNPFIDSPNKLKRRKARERARYIRGRGGDVEYDIAPFFVWRTC